MIDFLIFIIAAPLLIIAVLYLLEPDKKFFRDVLQEMLAPVYLFGAAAYILLPLLLTLAAIAFGIAMFVKLVMFFI